MRDRRNSKIQSNYQEIENIYINTLFSNVNIYNDRIYTLLLVIK